ncbi:response regulator transcription factor [Roseofilum sp. BLCC_M154]|uniref:Response regulator transcription factor n=1 Tax=Roseofilum acuticapitatum BLCC-M154 TaxID=3022444 RepID=A0ABT7B0S8_9CYAN|nr:response regulator transcription factor [Roseofilum acuticapitatum]MDJ1172264.1 response regulator transcription factor [Roseofilum acuticapitatum BLCC-M154]
MVSIGIQIIESNPHLRSLLGWHLQQAGYSVYQSADSASARHVYMVREPTLVVLDSSISGGQGLELCQWMHNQQRSLILMLSARDAESDVVAGLQAGADDYLTKPFGMQEFMARVQALIRRQKKLTPPAYLNYGDLKIDLVQRRVSLQGVSIDLTPQEFSLLYALAQVGGQPLSRSQLLQRAWPDEIDNPRTVDTHVLSLRKKIEIDPRQPHVIQTVRKVGYRFNQDALSQQRRSPFLTRSPSLSAQHRLPMKQSD